MVIINASILGIFYFSVLLTLNILTLTIEAPLCPPQSAYLDRWSPSHKRAYSFPHCPSPTVDELTTHKLTYLIHSLPSLLISRFILSLRGLLANPNPIADPNSTTFTRMTFTRGSLRFAPRAEALVGSGAEGDEEDEEGKDLQLEPIRRYESTRQGEMHVLDDGAVEDGTLCANKSSAQGI
ncbi:hypothetical protein EIP86_008520 [Pleurotus ostreatoroseus]|nr:hypothetical protein EIP86_008520 [Pleurotus ostreatoroseus]